MRDIKRYVRSRGWAVGPIVALMFTPPRVYSWAFGWSLSESGFAAMIAFCMALVMAMILLMEVGIELTSDVSRKLTNVGFYEEEARRKSQKK